MGPGRKRVRSDRFARGVLLATALAFVGPGLGFLLAPERFAAAVDLSLGSSTAASDVRAVFGGLEIAIGAWLGAAALRTREVAGALALQRVALGGMLVGRVASVVLDGVPGSIGWALGGIEVALFALGAVAGRRG
jgi:hypothetical protein